MVFGGARPVVLNGIEDFAVRGDLIDRSILLTLPQIHRARRQAERVLWPAFEAVRPRILGALFSAVSTGLRNLPTTTLASLPRMADFATWVTACEPALGITPGTFISVYDARCREGGERALAANVIARVFVLWAKELLDAKLSHAHESTCEDMLACLTEVAKAKHGQDYPKQRAWPKGAHVLSNHLRRLQPALLTAGIKIEFDVRGNSGERLVRLTQVP